MVKDDMFDNNKVDDVPTIDDFLEEESKNKRKKSTIFLEDSYDDVLDYDYEDDEVSSSSGGNGFSKKWTDDGMSEVDDLFDDDEDF